MKKIILFLSFAISAFSCASIRTQGISPEKNASESDFLLASFFDAPDSAPEIRTLEVFFSSEEKASLKRQSKAEIGDFAAWVLACEDYEIFYDGFSGPDAAKLYEKREEAVKKALIKNGIDRDRIFVKERSGDLNEVCEEAKKDCAVIEAQAWR
jgi:outer membrane protein OmpA-like peptidoglycan-associated protein